MVPGELTGPQATEPLVVVSDTSNVRVRAYVEELDAPRVCVGMSARITADGMPNASFTGTVISISPQMAGKSFHSDHPNELYDTKMREVLVELSDVQNSIVGCVLMCRSRLGRQRLSTTVDRHSFTWCS